MFFLIRCLDNIISILDSIQRKDYLKKYEYFLINSFLFYIFLLLTIHVMHNLKKDGIYNIYNY